MSRPKAVDSPPTAPADDFPPVVLRKGRKGSGGRRPAPTAAQALQNARKATKGIKIGRPRTYTSELCDEAVKLGSKGYSKASIAYTFGVSRAVLDNWAKEFPAFMEALARAHDAAQHWFERHGQRNLKADRYQAQVWTRRMQAQFNEYKDLPPSMNVSIGGELLDAITQATKHRQQAIEAAAKRVEPLDVVINDVESAPEKG
jgi:hypothetical protein